MDAKSDLKPSMASTRGIASVQMLGGAIVRPMMALAAPMVTVLVAQTLVGIAEAFYVGRLGTDKLAGATLVFPLTMLMTMMANGGIGGGVASAIARATGAGRRDDANALAWHAVVLALIFGSLFTAGAILLGPYLYVALGGRSEVLESAVTYSTFMFAASVPTWITNLMAASLRGVGNVKVPALVTLLGSALLVPLSPLLIFGLGPMPGPRHRRRGHRRDGLLYRSDGFPRLVYGVGSRWLDAPDRATALAPLRSHFEGRFDLRPRDPDREPDSRCRHRADRTVRRNRHRRLWRGIAGSISC